MLLGYFKCPLFLNLKLFDQKNIIKKVNPKNLVSDFNSKQIVVWGNNLSSNVGGPQFTKKIQNLIKLPPIKESIIIGVVLSDGYLFFGSSKTINATLHIHHSLKQFDYV